MKRVVVLIAALFVPLCSLQAQEKGQGYLFFAPGVSTTHEGEFGPATFHVGGGGERFIYRGAGVGVEIGYVALWSASGDGPGVGSVNASYHLRHGATAGSVEPFVTAGYTLFARHGTVSSANFGGGINYWLRSKAAVRFETRYQGIGLHVPYFGGAAPNVEFRIGLTWR